MIICLLCVLKDSANITEQILCDFNQANGYALLRNFILSLVSIFSLKPDFLVGAEVEYANLINFFSNQANEDGMRNILVMLMSVITSGFVEIEPRVPPGLIVLPTFVLPAASGSGLSVRNVEAFRVLSEVIVQVNFLHYFFYCLLSKYV